MCGRYSLAGPSPAELRERFEVGASVELRRRFNVCPGDDVACVTAGRDGAPRGELLRWGLVPHWSRDPAGGVKMINARAETVAGKPAYRDAFARRRCLVLADGFYEWQSRPGERRKQPWHVTRSDGAPFAFAGLWETWHGDGGVVLRTCTIVTTQANAVLAEVHDRMPVILPARDAEIAWLDPGTPAAALHDLLAPLPDALTARRAVGPAVSDARYDGPECLADAVPEAEQGALF
ncbi:MAG TPA: SOS response-associated peptidase [Baekduia sp.]|nr:SOS response-associated peptidase [Baekduia sp.]